MLCPIVRNPSAANKVSRDASQRIQNLNFLVQQIKTYYLVSFVSRPSNMLWNVYPSCLAFSLHRIMISERLMWVSQFHLSLSCPSRTHTPPRTCSNQIFGRSRVPADQLALLKMRALHIRHVHICVISTGARLERQQRATVKLQSQTDRVALE